MRIRRSSGSPPWLNRRDQYRLLKMVGVLMLIVVAIQIAAKEETWHWLFPPQHAATAPRDAETPAETQQQPDFDVRLERELQPGEFVAPPAESREAALQKLKEAAEAAIPEEVAEDTLRIEPDLLSAVRDNSLGIRRDEAAAFNAVLARAAQLSENQLEQAAPRTTAFRVLMVDASHFRGRPVSIAGRLRRLLPFEAGPNEFDLNQLYEAWITPDDSPERPVRVVFTLENSTLPTGEGLDVPVQAAGFFFKLEGYAARGGLTTTPLILARTVHRHEGTGSLGAGGPPPIDTSLVNWLVGLMVLIAGSLGLMVWRFHTGDKRYRRTVYQRVLDAPEGAIEALAGVETQTAMEFFQEYDTPRGRAADEGGAGQAEPRASQPN